MVKVIPAYIDEEKKIIKFEADPLLVKILTAEKARFKIIDELITRESRYKTVVMKLNDAFATLGDICTITKYQIICRFQ